MYSNLQHSASIRLLMISMEYAGLANFHRRSPAWNSLQEVYCTFVYGIMCFAIACHWLSTVTRAVRYVPEFSQCLFEDVAMWNLCLQSLFIKSNYKAINEMNNFMENSFSRVDQKIIVRTNRTNDNILKIFLLSNIWVLLAVLTESFIPMSEEEIELHRNIYRTEHPDRKHAAKMKIPYVDETEWVVYYSFFCLMIYLTLILLLITSLCDNLLPFLTFHLSAQYQILCQYIDKLGSLHYNVRGEEILYTNIETNDYQVKNKLPRKYLNISSQRNHERYLYQKSYLIQIIKFHQKLIIFQEKIRKFYVLNVLYQTINNYVNSALVLYQLVLTPHLFRYRVYKFVGELLTFHIVNYYWCHCSELMDDCNRMVAKSLWSSQWMNCDVRLRKDIEMMLRRVQKANQFQFCDGTIRLGKVYFMHIVKIGYTFVNFARSSS